MGDARIRGRRPVTAATLVVPQPEEMDQHQIDDGRERHRVARSRAGRMLAEEIGQHRQRRGAVVVHGEGDDVRQAAEQVVPVPSIQVVAAGDEVDIKGIGIRRLGRATRQLSESDRKITETMTAPMRYEDDAAHSQRDR